MIIIEPYGGLANRMRVIASCLWLQKQSIKNVVQVIWNIDKDLNCEFKYLFKPISNTEIISKKTFHKLIKATNQKKIHKKFLSYLINQSMGIDYCLKDNDFHQYIWNKKNDNDTGKFFNSGEEFNEFILEIAKKKKKIFINTCEEFGNNLDEFSNFVPTDEIQNSINQQTNQFNSETIGLHIRRTDNIISIEQSPLNLFINQIKSEISINPKANFFLATDEKNVENELKLLFGNKILTFEKEISRITQKGMIDAVVDMYCLAQTKYIYGSFWSSFSDIAARIGKIKYIPLKK